MLIEQTAESTPRRDILDALWRLGSGRIARLVLLALLALSVALGTLLPQLPPAAASDTATANRWLSTTATRYGMWGRLVRALDLFDIAHAFWFRLLLSLLAFHLLLRTAEAAQTVWTTLHSRRPPPIPPDVRQERSVSLPPPLHEAAAAVRAKLAAHRLRVLMEEETEMATGFRLYADRARTGLLGSLLSDAGALLLLAGLFVNGAWGWQAADILLAPSQEISLGHDTGLTLRLEKATPTDTQRLLFLDAGGQITSRSLGFGRPALYRGISVHQAGKGPALMVKGEDEEGKPLSLQPLTAEGAAAESVSLIFDQPQAERHLTVPARNLALRIVAHPGPPEGQPAFLVQVYQGGRSDPLLDTLISGEKVLQVAGARFRFQPQRYAVLQVVHAPGLALLLVGGLLLLIGAISPLLWPALQVWAELIPERRAVRVQLAGRTQRPEGAEEELALLVQAIKGTEPAAETAPKATRRERLLRWALALAYPCLTAALLVGLLWRYVVWGQPWRWTWVEGSSFIAWLATIAALQLTQRGW